MASSGRDFTPLVSVMAGCLGLLAFLVFSYLALQELPRPYLARGEVTLGEPERGVTTVKPRAMERVAEIAAQRHPNISTAAGRFGDRELNLDIGVRSGGLAAETLQDVAGAWTATWSVISCRPCRST